MSTVVDIPAVPLPEPEGPPPAAPPRRRSTERLENAGLILKFIGEILKRIANGQVFRFSGEVIRQAGILIVSSALVIWALIFIVGLQCGIEGAYLLQAQGAPQYAGLFASWCDLRELTPLAFGYMMAAKVGTGIVAEIGSMRISEEIDALEVMGINGITYLCSTRILASWMVLPFVYIGGVACGFAASYVAVVQQVANVSSGGYSMIFWEFQNPGDLLFSLIKAMAMATMIVLVGCYYGYTASGGPVGVGLATARSMVVNIVGVHVIAMLGTQLFWGANPRAPIGG
jgi:phospholipid/cholesterol/gamma-HCH transport system permease protein